MSTSDHKALSAARRPSLMADTAAHSVTPDARVLAGLGGQKRQPRRKGAMAALLAGLILMAAGGIYWAGSRSNTSALPPQVAALPATPAAAQVPTPSAVEARRPAQPVSEVPSPKATTAPEASAARIVRDDGNTVPDTLASPLAKPTPSPAAASGHDPHPAATAATHTDSPPARKAQGLPPAARSVNASKPSSTAVAKARPAQATAAKSARHAGSKRAEPASKGADPDTDLLAAMLRRSGGP